MGDSFYFRKCAYCGFFWEPIDIFCNTCWQKLSFQKTKDPAFLAKNVSFKTYSLYAWSFGEEKLLKNLIYSLKGGGLSEVFGYLAYEMSLHFHDSLKPEVFLCAPGKKEDHSESLAKALAGIWKVPYYKIFYKTKKVRQKNQKRSERAKLAFKVKTFNQEILTKNIVFVDDLQTTGATALAAYQALGKPAYFQSWVLVKKPRLKRSSFAI